MRLTHCLVVAACMLLVACDRTPPTTIPAPPGGSTTQPECGSTRTGQVHCLPMPDTAPEEVPHNP